ncbi:MAG: hypothetical protein Q8Q39_03125 [bacterium]|nr:hypothetical protein [bacterium]
MFSYLIVLLVGVAIGKYLLKDDPKADSHAGFKAKHHHDSIDQAVSSYATSSFEDIPDRQSEEGLMSSANPFGAGEEPIAEPSLRKPKATKVRKNPKSRKRKPVA